MTVTVYGTTEELSDAGLDGLLMVVLISGGQLIEFDLPEDGTFSIGRAAHADIRMDTPSLSPIHAILRGAKGAWTVQAADESSATLVNGVVCSGAQCPVRIGQKMQLGQVTAQLRWTSLPSLATRSVSPAEFDRRVRDEIERCIRFEHTLAAVLVEVDEDAARVQPDWAKLAAGGLRAGDLVTVRSRRRIDVAVAECSRSGAIDIAERIRGVLARKGVTARVGVATYPDDVPSAENLLFAAQQAMDSAEGAVGIARDGVRVMQVGDHQVVIAEPATIRLFGMLERVANANFPVVIRGESGTGKDMAARAIHELGRRAARAFIRVDCMAIADEDFERELFGYAAGDLPDAMRDTFGLIERAHKGTLFLDEVGEMPLAMQAKLLSVIEDGVVCPVGTTEAQPCNIRVVASTHRDLKAAVAEGSFRKDLFHRLSAIVLDMPALRDRPRTIQLLVERFAAAAAREAGHTEITVTDEALAALSRYGWPGNIRELRNVIVTAVQQCEGDVLDLEHLAEEIGQMRRGGDDDTRLSLPEQVRALERRRIVDALEQTSGHETRAAALLGIPRRTLLSKLRALGLEQST